ncbi:MAG: hypothetical protein L3J62_08570 [Gammaproteobacteria bacterium]|nr:hypothetical protein [Gammaproteobacteria bacterium]MCF6230828.1 hypothetical protein [Gammaproteobacteria bacterium]
MKASGENSLTATVYGMDERSCEALRMAFNGPGKECCTLTDDAASADMSIVNMDSVDGESLLEKVRNDYPLRHIIVLSVNDPQLEDTHYVARPIRVDMLIKTIKKVSQLPLLEPRRVGEAIAMKSELKEDAVTRHTEQVKAPAAEKVSRVEPKKRPVSRTRIPPVDFSQAESKESYFYDPENHLQGEVASAIKRAVKKNSAVQLSIRIGGEWKTITVLPEAKKVITSINETWLERLCTSPLCTLEVKMRTHNRKNSLELEYRAVETKAGSSMDAFLWRVALWSAQGRVPLGTDLNAPVYLRHWPNITRLRVSPSMMRAITLLIGQPRKLPLISQVLGIPYSQVFSLYSAAHAIGLAGSAHRMADSLIEPAPIKQHRLHGLFGKILNKLRPLHERMHG